MGLECGGRGVGPHHGRGGGGSGALVVRCRGRRRGRRRRGARDGLVSATGGIAAATAASVVVGRWSGGGVMVTDGLVMGRGRRVLPRVRGGGARCRGSDRRRGRRPAVLVVRESEHVWLGWRNVHYSIVMVMPGITVFCKRPKMHNNKLIQDDGENFLHWIH